jgi:uncharacterized membrane protein HdeD (DUF308 family)
MAGGRQVITFAVGLPVVTKWPASGLWVIGLFIGIDLIFYAAADSAFSRTLSWLVGHFGGGAQVSWAL